MQDTGLKIQINSQKAIVALILPVLFCSTIFQSCQPTNAGVVIREVQLGATVFSTNVDTQNQNVTYNGDLLVHNNQTFTIENAEFLITNGTITVEDTSTLIIRNSKFTTNPSRNAEGESIVLMNQAHLILTNTTVIFIHPSGDFNCKIIVQNDAEANITHSTFQNLIYVIGYENSVIHVNNSTIASKTFWNKSGGGNT